MKRAVTKRIRITRTGKIMRRHMGGDHFRAKKSSGEKQRKRKFATLAAGRIMRKLNSL